MFASYRICSYFLALAAVATRLLYSQRYLVTWSQEMVRRLRVTGSLGAGAVPQPNVRPEGELYWYERGYANPVGPIGRGKEFEVTGNMGN